MSLHAFSSRRRRRHGVTLILVLSFVLLLTAVVLVFLSRAMNARLLSSGSLKQSSSDQFALSALDVVTGNLKQEIASSTLSSSGTYNAVYTVYRPLSSTNAVPIRFGNPAGSPDPTPNLVRISSRSDGSQSFPSSLASAVNSTTDTSVNGRSVTLPRWNSHYLLPVQNSATASSDSTPVASFTPPDWVLVTDTGGPTVLTAPSPSVIGRYAYAIYDEGGLLDVNVAGYPTKSTTAQSGDKPALAYADLTQLALPSAPTTSLLSTTDVDNLVGWRNYASVQPTGSFGGFTISTSTQTQNFFNLIANNVTGFLSVNNATFNNLTDQAFLSRQQLIKYIASTGTDTTTHANSLHNALQYLGTFSRDLNAPSWSPATPSGSTIDYHGQKDSSSSANRDVLGVRVTGTFTRADGTIAQIGEPLVKYRFPLNRLHGITYQGINTGTVTTLSSGTLSVATAAAIQRDFGLVWNPGNGSGLTDDINSAPHWNYCGPSGSSIQNSIATLGSIGNREPNFFELLKAAILSGSLGRDAGANGSYLVNWEQGPASGVQTSDLNIDFQVIQLGANIIDQSDSDSYPTEIHLADPSNGNAETAFYGIENLPYLQRVFARTVGTYDSTGNTVIGAQGWYQAELWNPHQNFGYTNPSAVPTNFRFSGIGTSAMFLDSGVNSSSVDLSQSGYLQFTVNPVSGPAQNSCREPTLLSDDPSSPGQSNPPYLTPLVVSGTTGTNTCPSFSSISGIYTGTITITNNDPSVGFEPQNCALLLQYQAANNNWVTYSVMRNLTGKHDWSSKLLTFYYQHVDPRTDRFGTTLGQWTYAIPANPSATPPTAAVPAVHPPGQSIRQNRGSGWNGYDFFPLPASGFNYPPGNADSQIFNNYYMGSLSDNVGNVTDGSNALPSDPYYADQDGIVRPAEGAYAVDPQGDGRPLIPSPSGPFNSRPIIMNRPFRNVGELGYAFRDEPFKNVDFFTSSTGDAGLLDFFCINESTTTTPMVAGTVNLNTRQAPVLQAILAGAIKDETGAAYSPPGPPIPNTEAASIASAIVAWTQSSNSSQGPFQYRGDLLTKAASTLVATSADTADQQIKIRREAALRALSDVGTTRTWTLLVDLVAQVGHYPPGSTSLKQFVVDGEKRYWLHLTLDRYTGQVVDRVLEPVYE
jgi:Tfp pilus assembly protein PilX